MASCARPLLGSRRRTRGDRVKRRETPSPESERLARARHGRRVWGERVVHRREFADEPLNLARVETARLLQTVQKLPQAEIDAVENVGGGHTSPPLLRPSKGAAFERCDRSSTGDSPPWLSGAVTDEWGQSVCHLEVRGIPGSESLGL